MQIEHSYPKQKREIPRGGSLNWVSTIVNTGASLESRDTGPIEISVKISKPSQALVAHAVNPSNHNRGRPI